MTTFTPPPVPYEGLDPDDKVTRGRLMHAAARGDARARLTLKQWTKDTETEGQPDPPKKLHSGSVTAGAKMFQPRRPRDDDGPPAAA